MADDCNRMNYTLWYCINETNWTIDCQKNFGWSEEYIPLRFPLYIRTCASIVCGLILTLGTIGNLMVPLVVFKNKELRNSTNIFLINLSIADLLVLLVCMPSVLIELHSKPEVWILGEEMCKTVPFVELVVAHGSLLTILAISFERYYAICRPLKAGYTCTKMRALAVIIAVWMIAFSITCPILALTEYTYAHYVDGSLVPVCLTSAQSMWHKIYFLSTSAAFFWVPLIVLVVIYGVIAKHLMNSRCLIKSSMEHTQMKARKQVVLMLSTVVFCFFVCLTPFRVFTVWLTLVSQDKIEALGMETYYNLLYFCRVMLYINSAINPILYNLISSKFRNAFFHLIFCGTHKRLIRRTVTVSTSTTLRTSSTGGKSQVQTVASNTICKISPKKTYDKSFV
ncbi:growth hormone secretagogue receptor type 1-like [Centruroides vittatus]|uniref:growth hormone secretagogue receptor type 1-like n=1 Tax=Centruroides vittatus TaxID=120091 RepID=UPI0035108F07